MTKYKVFRKFPSSETVLFHSIRFTVSVSQSWIELNPDRQERPTRITINDDIGIFIVMLKLIARVSVDSHRRIIYSVHFNGMMAVMVRLLILSAEPGSQSYGDAYNQDRGRYAASNTQNRSPVPCLHNNWTESKNNKLPTIVNK